MDIQPHSFKWVMSVIVKEKKKIVNITLSAINRIELNHSKKKIAKQTNNEIKNSKKINTFCRNGNINPMNIRIQ